MAAFFATGMGDPLSAREGDVGVIYCVDPDDPVARPSGSDRPDGLDLMSTFGLKLGRLRIIEPKLPDPENRIARQKALFVEGFTSRDLQGFSLDTIYFCQQPGAAYEDPLLGITREHLLNGDAKLQKLAESITGNPSKLSPALARIAIPEDHLLGTLGLNLPAIIYQGQELLDEIAATADRIEPGLWSSLREIIVRYFEITTIAARTATDVAPGMGSFELDTRRGVAFKLDGVNAALNELSDVGYMEYKVLRNFLRDSRPLRPLNNNEVRRITLPDLAPKACLAMVTGMFLVSMEHLYVVRGDIARQLIQEASTHLSLKLKSSRVEL